MGTFYFRNTGSQSASTASNYSLTPGGGSAGIVPGSSDTVIFDSTSGDCTIDAAGISWNTLDLRASKTFTVSFALNIGTLAYANAAITSTFNGSDVNITNLNIANGTTILGSSKAVFGNPGTINVSGVSGVIRNNIDFNANINIVSSSGNATLNFGAPTSGTQNVNRLGGTISVNPAVTALLKNEAGGTANIDLNGINFTNFSINSFGTINLLKDITCVNIDWGVSANCVTNGSVMHCSGNSTMTNNITSQGTTVLRMTGTGILTADSVAGVYNRPIIIDSPGGTINFGSILRIKGAGASFKYISGNVIPGPYTVNIGNGCTIDSAGMTWNNVVADSGTTTLNSLLTCNSMAVASTATFNGTHGWTAANFSCATSGTAINVTYTAGRTYTVTGNLSVTGTSTNKVSFISSSTGALFNLQAGAVQNVQHCNATWMNSSGGQTIYTNAGTLTNTTNWNVGGPSRGNFFLMFR